MNPLTDYNLLWELFQIYVDDIDLLQANKHLHVDLPAEKHRVSNLSDISMETKNAMLSTLLGRERLIIRRIHDLNK